MSATPNSKSPSEFYEINKTIDNMIERTDKITAQLDTLTATLNSTVDDIISAADEATRISLNTLQVLKLLRVDADGTIRFELPKNSKSDTDTTEKTMNDF